MMRRQVARVCGRRGVPAAVHDSLARTTRTCAYSRAGLMWSDPAPGPFDARQAARDLHTALTASGEAAPWVMVAHSLGGLYVLLFTSCYGAEVAGLVHLDGSHPAQFPWFRDATGKSMQPGRWCATAARPALGLGGPVHSVCR
jgi:pimeloyl-ACP methyl ester carboxylesterase